MLDGTGDQTFPGGNRRRQSSRPWSSVGSRLCAGNADFDELTVYAKRSINLETSAVLDETELPEFVPEKSDVLARSADRRSSSQVFLARSLGTSPCSWPSFTVAGEQ